MTFGDGGDGGLDVLFEFVVGNGERSSVETFYEVNSAALSCIRWLSFRSAYANSLRRKHSNQLRRLIYLHSEILEYIERSKLDLVGLLAKLCISVMV
jgi:hypothetical protein